jgi:uncharacterized protein
MDLKDRLLQLQGQRGNAPTPDIGPSLPERLQRLLLGHERAGPTTTIDDQAVAIRLQGEVLTPGLIRIERRFALSTIPNGDFTATTMDRLCLLAQVEQLNPAELLFLDTETTGLAGGTGTLAFLLGLARIDGEQLHVRQWFLTGFKAEAALLSDAGQWLQATRHLVSFNGKCFDVPLLCTRYRLARLPTSLADVQHLDLLHPLRRAFGRRWPDCRLQTAEQRLLDLRRKDDLPGHLVPEIWGRFVRSGVIDQVPDILQHNVQDLISLAALLSPLSRTYFQPGYAGADSLAIARHLQQRDMRILARRHLQHNAADLEPAGLLELAELHRRCKAWPEALTIWQRLAADGHPLAMERLAKYHEHRDRDYRTALHWTEHLLACPGDVQQHQLRKTRLLARLAAI